MRTIVFAFVALAVAGCTSGGSASTSASGGTVGGASTSSGSAGTTGGGSTASSTTSTGSGGSTGSSGTTGVITVTLTSPDAGDCLSIHGLAPQYDMTATGFTFNGANGCQPGPCGVALLQLRGPAGSCDQNASPVPNSAFGQPPLTANMNGCPTSEGPNGPRTAPGSYTASIYLYDQSGATGTLLTAPDGGPFATVSFTESYGDGFRCDGDPEVVLERPLSRRLDGLAIAGGRIFVSENAGGLGALISIPEAIQPLDAGVQVLISATDLSGNFWPSNVATDGVSVFVDQDNGGNGVIAVPVGGGALVQEGAGAVVASGPGGTCWNGSGGIWLAPTGQTTASVAVPGIGAAAIAVDGSGVYFLGNGIDVAPANGGSATTLVPPIAGENPVAIAVDANHVYWTESAQLGGALSRIRVADKNTPDGGSQVLLDDQILPAALVVDSSGPGGPVVYFAWGQVSISRFIPEDGGLAQVGNAYTGHSGGALTWMAVDGPYLYWVDDSHVYRALK